MPNEKSLFNRDRPIGTFKGFTESGREFVAEILAPYNQEFIPLLGSFILVAVTDNQTLLGRITQFYPMGTMAGAEADEYLSHLHRLGQPIPEDVKELKLRYNIKVRLLGTVECNNNQFRYRPGVRMLPHLGAVVYSPTEEALEFICNACLEEEPDAIPIGYYALGDQVNEELEIKFSFSRLRSKRTLVFARAGYGKSNLIKLLVSKLYENKNNQQVGMLIFDPEGEYAFPDAEGRPGLADLPGLAKRLVVFTDRRPPEDKYKSFIVGSVKLNIAQVPPTHVLDNCLPEEKQESVFVTRLRGLHQEEWRKLVDLVHGKGYRTEKKDLIEVFGSIEDQQLNAVIRNIPPIVRRLHDPRSNLLHSVLFHLAQGHIVIVDISLLSSGTGQEVAGLILKTIFEHNVTHFTADEREAVIPVITVIEEAQSVLSSEKMKRGDSPFVEWVKEGRKYNLGAIIVTQQPGAISDQLLSQGDNFFVLHLVSGVDLDALKRNNAHFSDDILSYILNEPIEGNAYFWSAPSQPYVISCKLLNFQEYVQECNSKSNQEGNSAEEANIISPAQRYQQLIQEIMELIKEIIEADNKVPIYTPEKDNMILEGYGLINQYNLQFRVPDKFFSNHPELKPWMLSEYFEIWENGRPALKKQHLSQFGEFCNGTKENKQNPYLLIDLSKINLNKGLNSQKVILERQEE